jgi:hypothetical protein
MTFPPGLHHHSDAKHFPRCLVSINTIRDRKGGFEVGEWMMVSCAFTELAKCGRYRHKPQVYAEPIVRRAGNGTPLVAVRQDCMGEEFSLEKTGPTVEDHERLTIERHDRIRTAAPGPIHILPVLQGYAPSAYCPHIRQYGP